MRHFVFNFNEDHFGITDIAIPLRPFASFYVSLLSSDFSVHALVQLSIKKTSYLCGRLRFSIFRASCIFVLMLWKHISHVLAAQVSSGAVWCAPSVLLVSSWPAPGQHLARSWRAPGVLLALPACSWRAPGELLACSWRAPAAGVLLASSWRASGVLLASFGVLWAYSWCTPGLPGQISGFWTPSTDPLENLMHFHGFPPPGLPGQISGFCAPSADPPENLP